MCDRNHTRFNRHDINTLQMLVCITSWPKTSYTEMFVKSAPDPPAHGALLHVPETPTHCCSRARRQTSKSAAHFNQSIPLMDIPRRLPKSPGLPRSIPCSRSVNQHHNTPLPHTQVLASESAWNAHQKEASTLLPFRKCIPMPLWCTVRPRSTERAVWFGGWQVQELYS